MPPLCSLPSISRPSTLSQLNRTHDAHMFYMYFESRSAKPEDDPLVSAWMERWVKRDKRETKRIGKPSSGPSRSRPHQPPSFLLPLTPLPFSTQVLWMTGGPGCSSELAVFFENGPYRINVRASEERARARAREIESESVSVPAQERQAKPLSPHHSPIPILTSPFHTFSSVRSHPHPQSVRLGRLPQHAVHRPARRDGLLLDRFRRG